MGALVKRAMHARRTRTRGGKKLLWAMGLLVAYFVVAMPLLAYMGSDSFQGEEGAHGRRLSGSTECDGDEGGAGEAVMYFLIILFCFLGLAVVCDDFFVPSLELISERLNLSEDVAGATFMAAGSSAPELFTSVADAFGPRNSLGIGTIVGSAMFNILVIVAMSAAAAKQTLVIDWRPLVRDCAFYGLSLVLMTVMVLTGDGVVEWWEGVIMVVGYLGYVLFMTINGRVFDWCDRTCNKKNKVGPKQGRGSQTELEAIEAVKKELHLDNEGKPVVDSASGTTGGTPANNTNGLAAQADKDGVVPITNQDLEAGDAPTPGGGAVMAANSKEGEDAKKSEGDGEQEEEEEESRFAWPDSWPERILFIVSFPFLVAFTYTIPDCGKPKWEAWYVVSFAMSIVWIGGLCWGMVVCASEVGCILNIDPPVMGVVVLAVGTSIPDALGSMIVARQGEADMAIANAVGSNVFDILLGLGLPWFLSYFVHDAPTLVNVSGIGTSLAILYGTVFLFLGVIAVNKFRFNSKLGYIFFSMYLLYLTYTLLAEYCVSGIPVAGSRCD